MNLTDEIHLYILIKDIPCRKLLLPLFQLCMEYEYLVKAIFAKACAVAVVIG